MCLSMPCILCLSVQIVRLKTNRYSFEAQAVARLPRENCKAETAITRQGNGRAISL